MGHAADNPETERARRMSHVPQSGARLHVTTVATPCGYRVESTNTVSLPRTTAASGGSGRQNRQRSSRPASRFRRFPGRPSRPQRGLRGNNGGRIKEASARRSGLPAFRIAARRPGLTAKSSRLRTRSRPSVRARTLRPRQIHVHAACAAVTAIQHARVERDDRGAIQRGIPDATRLLHTPAGSTPSAIRSPGSIAEPNAPARSTFSRP